MHSTETPEGERLRRAIEAQWPRLRLAEFAGRMGITRLTLSHYLAGRRNPPAGFWPAAERELARRQAQQEKELAAA